MIQMIASISICLLLLSLTSVFCIRIILSVKGTSEIGKVIDKVLIISIIPTLVAILILYSKQNWYEVYKQEAFKTMLSVRAVPSTNSDLLKDKLQTLSIFDGPLKTDLESHLKLANGNLTCVVLESNTKIDLWKNITHYPFFTEKDLNYKKCLSLRLQGLCAAQYFFNKLNSISTRPVLSVDAEIINDAKFKESVDGSLKIFEEAKTIFDIELSNIEEYSDFLFVIDTNLAVTYMVKARIENDKDKKLEHLDKAFSAIEGVIYKITNKPLRAQYIVNEASIIGLMYSYGLKDAIWCENHLKNLVNLVINKHDYMDIDDKNRIYDSFKDSNINMYELHDYIKSNKVSWEQIAESITKLKR